MAKHVEVKIEERPGVELKIDGDVDAIVEVIKQHAGFTEEIFLFERDGEPIATIDITTRTALDLVCHRCKEVLVTVRFEHQEEPHHFKPSATINQVLQWAVKKFKLDATARSKANLILPGADQPLSKDEVLAHLVNFPHCSLVLELTLKDFTNGHA